MHRDALLHLRLRCAGRLRTTFLKLAELDAFFGDVDCHWHTAGKGLGFFAPEAECGPVGIRAFAGAAQNANVLNLGQGEAAINIALGCGDQPIKRGDRAVGARNTLFARGATGSQHHEREEN